MDRYTKTANPIRKPQETKVKIFTVKDTKAQTYETPFAQRNEIVALRTFSAEVNREDPRNTLWTNPEDFELHCIGDFNMETGDLVAHTPNLIGTAISLKQKDETP